MTFLLLLGLLMPAITHTESISDAKYHETLNQLYFLASESASFVSHRLFHLQNNIVQQLVTEGEPYALEKRELIEQEVIIRFYKEAYNQIWNDKLPGSICPPKILWLLAVPNDFKTAVEELSNARAKAIECDIIDPIKSWFPETLKTEIADFVHTLHERELVLLLYTFYAIAFNGYNYINREAWQQYTDYKTVYEQVHTSLAECSSPETRALFRRVYTPEEHEIAYKTLLTTIHPIQY